MAFCTACGGDVPNGVKFCTFCGKTMAESSVAPPVQQQVYTQPRVQGQPAPPPGYAQAPGYNQPASTGKPTGQYAVVSTMGWIGSLILLCIPIVGQIVCLVWAFGSGNHNRRNYARAILILAIVCIVLGIVFGAVLLPALINAATPYLEQFQQRLKEQIQEPAAVGMLMFMIGM